ncbi:MipA/OmpV family protein [Telluria beijingensis]|uniref:MipA/OmpV family protein n=1 Tax=Telluria beijingensis TaxID=3068633 RepID=UPI00279628C4|nr:MipA/OmpV family protein [Massilia sp. REN29]
MHPTFKAAIAAACLISAAHASAQSMEPANLPLWEFGVGAFGLTAPAYPGSEDRNNRVLPVPYLLYRGEVLRADQSGIGARLFRSDRLEFDVGLAGALPSDSDDVEIRAGMPDLGALFEFGPRLKIRVADIDRNSRLRAELPLRAVIEARGGLRRQGWTFEPKLAYETRGERGLWSVEGNVSVVFGDKRINRYFYEVQPQYVNASRAAYSADAGLMLTRVGLFATRQLNPDVRLFGFVRYESYAGSANRDSPLHLKNSGTSAGIGFAWTLARSSRRAAGYEPIDPVTP